MRENCKIHPFIPEPYPCKLCKERAEQAKYVKLEAKNEMAVDFIKSALMGGGYTNFNEKMVSHCFKMADIATNKIFNERGE